MFDLASLWLSLIPMARSPGGSDAPKLFSTLGG